MKLIKVKGRDIDLDRIENPRLRIIIRDRCDNNAERTGYPDHYDIHPPYRDYTDYRDGDPPTYRDYQDQ